MPIRPWTIFRLLFCSGASYLSVPEPVSSAFASAELRKLSVIFSKGDSVEIPAGRSLKEKGRARYKHVGIHNKAASSYIPER
jgi:hypothetical protein